VSAYDDIIASNRSGFLDLRESLSGTHTHTQLCLNGSGLFYPHRPFLHLNEVYVFNELKPNARAVLLFRNVLGFYFT